MNLTCQEDGKIEELPIGIFINLVSVMSFLLTNFGNLLLATIVYYEKFGQDPQKRSLPDQLMSFNMMQGIFISISNSIIIIVRIFFGPVGFLVSDFRYYLISSQYSILLGLSEATLIRCMILFSWKIYSMMNDEFFSTFLNLFNFMIGQMFSVIRFFTGDFVYHNGYPIYTGYCSNIKEKTL